jgi:hypothetical protein
VVVFHFVLGLQDHRLGNELGPDKGREDTAGNDHEKKTEYELGAQGKLVQGDNFRKSR